MSRFDPLASDSPLIVYIDYKSPYAFVAKDPTYAIEDQLDLEVDWRPLTLDIPSYLGSAKLDSRGKLVENNRSPQQWSGVRYAYHGARRYARLRGYTLRWILTGRPATAPDIAYRHLDTAEGSR